MERFKLENSVSHTYLVYELSSEEVLDSVDFQMVTNNAIPGFSRVYYAQMDAQRFLKYDVTGKIAANILLDGVVSKKRFLGILRSIAQAMGQLEHYMLRADSILLAPEYLYVSVAKNEVSLLCLPVVEQNVAQTELPVLLRDLVLRTQFDHSEDSSYVARLLSFLNQNVDFRPDALLAFLDTLDRSPVSESVTARASAVVSQPQPPVSAPQPAPSVTTKPASRPTSEPPQISLMYLLQHYNEENAELYRRQQAEKKQKKQAEKAMPSVSGKKAKPAKREKKAVPAPAFSVPGVSDLPPVKVGSAAPPVPQPSKPEIIPAAPVADLERSVSLPESPSPSAPQPSNSVSEETELYCADETILLEEESQPLSPTLLRKGTQERIQILTPIFRIGRDGEFNHYVVHGNKHIGHTHCHIVTKNGEYFIVDDNSKNHTYVDAKAIPSGTEVKLVHEQNIRIADEEFQFLLY